MSLKPGGLKPIAPLYNKSIVNLRWYFDNYHNDLTVVREKKEVRKILTRN